MPPTQNQVPPTETFPTIIDIRRKSQERAIRCTTNHSSTGEDEHHLLDNLIMSNSVSAIKKDDLNTPFMQIEEKQTTGFVDYVEIESGSELRKRILDGLTPPRGQLKSIPTVVLYDDKGLQIYDRITYLEEYYLVQEEIDILEADSDKIVDLIPDNSVVVELGSGSLRKTVVLLNALEKRRQNIRYFALDLMRDELTKSLACLDGYKNVTTAGLWGTYEEGMTFISSFSPEVPKTIVWLGSSIGNLNRIEAREFISAYRDILNVGDNWLIGIDRRNSAKDITLAYNDPSSITREFIMNGLHHVNAIFRQPIIDPKKFDYFGRYNEEVGRHEAYYRSLVSHDLAYTAPGGIVNLIHIEKDELINVEYSYKWSLEESRQLFEEAEMAHIAQWASPTNRYDLHMLQKVPFNIKSVLCYERILGEATPSVHEWKELWKAWNFVTNGIIGSVLMEKPIEFRHPFLFYIGHIPAFLDIQLSKYLNEPFTEPKYFTEIFERGIDPDVKNPTKCHEHSMVPDKWPDIIDIIKYRDEVYERLLRLLTHDSLQTKTRRLARVLFMTFEHQAMHLETIMYMLVQSNHIFQFSKLTAPWSEGVSCSTKPSGSVPQAFWMEINPKLLSADILTLGHNDAESADFGSKVNDLISPFGWDNEHPLVEVGKEMILPKTFAIQSRQVTNGEYLKFLESNSTDCINDVKLPKSWIRIKGTSDIRVKTIFGPVPFTIAEGWPVACSQVEAAAYAIWLDPVERTYRLPTEHELSIAFKLKQYSAYGIFHENYGFKAWYPLASFAEHPVNLCGWSNFEGPGGLWDWTSSVFEPLGKSYSVSEVYPGYSNDFFDGKHFVLLGASWATHTRIAERRSFRNWYQGDYEYAFAGFRLVKDGV